MYAIPVLVIAVPEHLRKRGRATTPNSSVPAWLAGFAAILTWIFLILLHYGGQFMVAALQKTPQGVLSVAAFGVAVLLMPFYRIVAKECLQRGAAVALDPMQWWSAWCAAYGEMRGRPAVIAKLGDDAQLETIRVQKHGMRLPRDGGIREETGSDLGVSARLTERASRSDV